MNFVPLLTFLGFCVIVTYVMVTHFKGLTQTLQGSFGHLTGWRALHALVHFVAFFLIEPQWWPILVASGVGWELVEMGMGGCYENPTSSACREWFTEKNVIISASIDVAANTIGLVLAALTAAILRR